MGEGDAIYAVVIGKVRLSLAIGSAMTVVLCLLYVLSFSPEDPLRV
jgi:hypothetical protein